MYLLEVYLNFLHFWSELLILHLRHVKQPLAGDGTRLVFVLVREVDDGLDARLDDNLGALVAGEESDVDATAVNTLRVLVEDGVHLSVADIHVFVFKPVMRLRVSKTRQIRASWTTHWS